jgi:hypothetical protein
VVTADVNGFNAFEGGVRLRGVKRGLDGGASYGVKMATRGIELGGVGRPDAAGFGGGVARVGRRGAGKQGPCVSEGRERRHQEWKA